MAPDCFGFSKYTAQEVSFYPQSFAHFLTVLQRIYYLLLLVGIELLHVRSYSGNLDYTADENQRKITTEHLTVLTFGQVLKITAKFSS